jgi:hypothetical protein
VKTFWNALSFNEDNSVLACGCKAIQVTAAAWGVMTEVEQDKIRDQARDCTTCKRDAERKPS